MSDMNTVENKDANAAFRQTFTPSVHRVGRISGAVAILATFLPVIYLIFVKGYQMPIEAYINVAITVASFQIGV